jgi:LysM repeat protein
MKSLLSYGKWVKLLAAGAVLLASLGFTPVFAAQSSCGASYTVQPGDYLTKIARLCGVSYSDLLQANPYITYPSLIYPGQVLIIPTGNGPARIRFAADGTSTNVQGKLAANSKLDYLLNAAAGQTLEVTLSPSSGLTLAIFGADGSTIDSASSNLSFRGVLPKTQDYILELATGSSDTEYSLNVDIPQRIRFAAGSSFANLTGTVPAYLSQFFILGAAKGQTLNVTATPPDKLQLIIYGVDGSVLRSGMGEGASFSGVLPSTQDYILVLRSASQAQAFTLNVQVPAASPVPVIGAPSYTVQRGDTLFSIALRFQTTVNILLRANPNITNRNVIPVGQIIYLPGATLKLSGGQIVYIANGGDTLGSIARKFTTTLNALISANPQISNPNLIFPGQRINIA